MQKNMENYYIVTSEAPSQEPLLSLPALGLVDFGSFATAGRREGRSEPTEPRGQFHGGGHELVS